MDIERLKALRAEVLHILSTHRHGIGQSALFNRCHKARTLAEVQGVVRTMASRKEIRLDKDGLVFPASPLEYVPDLKAAAVRKPVPPVAPVDDEEPAPIAAARVAIAKAAAPKPRVGWRKSPIRQMILDGMGSETMTMRQIADKIGVEPGQVSANLVHLANAGQVKRIKREGELLLWERTGIIRRAAPVAEPAPQQTAVEPSPAPPAEPKTPVTEPVITTPAEPEPAPQAKPAATPTSPVLDDLQFVAKPAPASLMPEAKWAKTINAQRIADILSAMDRYVDHDKPVPAEWIRELRRRQGATSEARSDVSSE